MGPTTRRASRWRHLAMLAAVPAVLVGSAHLAPGVGLLDRVEFTTVDWRFRMRRPLEPDPRLLIVEVSDRSLQQIGPWPWPRERWAQIIERLSAAGAAAILVDIFFPERSDPAADRALVEATRRAGNVFHAAFEAPGPELGDDSGPYLPSQAALAVQVQPGAGLDAGARLASFRGLLGPFAELAAAAAGLGFVDIVDAGDGTFRYTWPVAQVGEQTYAALAVRAARKLLEVGEGPLPLQLGRHLELGPERQVPLDRAGRMTINYLGPRGSLPRLEAERLLSSAAPADLLTGRIVVIGATAVGLHDLRPTPFGADFEGVEIQATLLDNLLTGRLLRETRPEYGLLLILLMAALVAAAFCGLPPLGGSVVCAALAVAYAYLGWWAFAARGLILPLTAPLATLMLVWLLALAYWATRHEQEVARSRRRLRRYLSPLAVAQMEDEAGISAEGARRTVTILFSDLRDFTAASSRLGAEAVVALLNRYFSLMYETLAEFGGTLDKYLGDGLLAYFLSPPGDTEHAALAVHAAVEMQRRIRANRDEWAFCGMPDLRAGIGITTGEVVMGNIGAPERMEHTVIGSEVNLAARLAELTKTRSEDILMDEHTWELAQEYLETVSLGAVEIRGYSEPIRIYTVIAGS